MRDSSSGSAGLGVGVLACHVVEEIVDVGEEVIVGEVVVGDRIVRDEAASSRAERSSKTLSPFLLGNVAENKNFPTVSPRSIYEFI